MGPEVTAAVTGVGAASGALRLSAATVHEAWGRSGGRGQVAVCGPDQDALTLAWSAAVDALAAARVDPATVGGLWWGCPRPPFAEGPALAFLASALHLPERLAGAVTGRDHHAGADALTAAVDAVRAGRVTHAIVVTSDASVPGPGTALETRAGAAAVALVVTTRGAAAITVGPTTTRPVLGQYRGDHEPVTRDGYDARLYREEVFLPQVVQAGEELVAGPLAGAAPATWSLPDPDGRMGATAARAMGAAVSGAAAAHAAVGHTAATPLLGLASALTGGGTHAVVLHGGGRTTAISITTRAGVPGAEHIDAALGGGRACSYTEAVRARGVLNPFGEQVAMGLPPGGAAFVRGNAEMLGLIGARCVACSTVVTPPSVHPRCTGCGSDKLEPTQLARHGRVHTVVVNQVMPPPFEAPLPLAVVDLDDGARVMVQGIAPSELGVELAIDSPVELVLRRYAMERGVPVYGYKCRGVEEAR